MTIAGCVTSLGCAGEVFSPSLLEARGFCSAGKQTTRSKLHRHCCVEIHWYFTTYIHKKIRLAWGLFLYFCFIFLSYFRGGMRPALSSEWTHTNWLGVTSTRRAWHVRISHTRVAQDALDSA